MNRSPDEREEQLDRYLAQLPSALPDAGVGDAVVSRHLRRRRLRRILPPLAAAATLLLWAGLHRPETTVPPDSSARINPDMVELRSIDRRLQAAYIDGAAPAELAALWAERGRLAHATASPLDATTRRVRL